MRRMSSLRPDELMHYGVKNRSGRKPKKGAKKAYDFLFDEKPVEGYSRNKKSSSSGSSNSSKFKDVASKYADATAPEWAKKQKKKQEEWIATNVYAKRQEYLKSKTPAAKYSKKKAQDKVVNELRDKMKAPINALKASNKVKQASAKAVWDNSVQKAKDSMKRKSKLKK